MNNTQKLNKGIYLIVDPSKDFDQTIGRLKKILHLPISAVQIWDNFSSGSNEHKVIDTVSKLCHTFHKPVLINNRWEWLLRIPLDGIHFDTIPENINTITQSIGRPFLKGLTCNNDLSQVEWAYHNGFDYVSFCSVFPSTTANSCELVDLEIVKQAIERYKLPVFLAGGITPANLSRLSNIPYHGIAVVSGIMSADDPVLATQQYIQKLKM